VHAQAHVLRTMPQLTFQQAANWPDGRAPARAAAARWASGAERRSWLRWLNKPQGRDACLLTLSGHGGVVGACAWSLDGARIASGSWDGTLKVWDARSGAALATGHSDRLQACAWSPDGTRIAGVSGRDGTLIVWDARSGAKLATLIGHGELLESCAWSPDGARIVAASDYGALTVWDASSGAELATLTVHGDWEAESYVWSPDGARIASGSWDGTLRIWDARSGAELATLTGLGGRFGVPDCAWSPDGAQLAAGGASVWFYLLRLEGLADGASIVTA